MSRVLIRLGRAQPDRGPRLPASAVVLLRKRQSNPMGGVEVLVEYNHQLFAVFRERDALRLEARELAQEQWRIRARLEPIDSSATVFGHVLGRVRAQHDRTVGQ